MAERSFSVSAGNGAQLAGNCGNSVPQKEHDPWFAPIKHRKAPKGSSKTPTAHEEIRKWVGSRGGKSAYGRSGGKTYDADFVRIEFPRSSAEGRLEPISEDFFDEFDKFGLAFVNDPDKESRFSIIVSR